MRGNELKLRLGRLELDISKTLFSEHGEVVKQVAQESDGVTNQGGL